MTSPTIAPITPTEAAPTIAHRTGSGKPRSPTAIAFMASFSPTRQGLFSDPIEGRGITPVAIARLGSIALDCAEPAVLIAF
jgi:hypothetical protein